MLTLPIKAAWFSMIESGEKKEEYRATTPYYRARFKSIFAMYPYSFIPCGTDHQKIRLRNGYAATSPTLEIDCTLDLRTGREEWGAERGIEYYVLKIFECKRVQL